MTAGDIIIAVKQVTKVLGTNISNNTLFTPTDIPASANIVSVEAHPRTSTGGDVVYDIVATAEATV